MKKNKYQVQYLEKSREVDEHNLPKSFTIKKQSVVSVVTVIIDYGVPSGGDSHDVRRTFKNKGYDVISVVKLEEV